jgi:hypothetical protein
MIVLSRLVVYNDGGGRDERAFFSITPTTRGAQKTPQMTDQELAQRIQRATNVRTGVPRGISGADVVRDSVCRQRRGGRKLVQDCSLTSDRSRQMTIRSAFGSICSRPFGIVRSTRVVGRAWARLG